MDFKKPHIYRRKIIYTGKFYIGKHKGGDKYYKGSGVEYKIDLLKYKEYETEILEYVDDISKLNEREEYWLNQVDAANNPLYYNKTNKSFGPISHTKDWKENQSKRMKGKSTTKGKKWKVKDTSNMIGGGFKGKKHTDETIIKMKNNSSRNKKISEALKGRKLKQKTKDKIYTKERNAKISKTRGKGILQYDLEGNFIKEWISYGEVKKYGFLGVQGAIKRNKPYKGYIWKNKNN
jgi:hypothetical protein